MVGWLVTLKTDYAQKRLKPCLRNSLRIRLKNVSCVCTCVSTREFYCPCARYHVLAIQTCLLSFLFGCHLTHNRPTNQSTIYRPNSMGSHNGNNQRHVSSRAPCGVPDVTIVSHAVRNAATRLATLMRCGTNLGAASVIGPSDQFRTVSSASSLTADQQVPLSSMLIPWFTTGSAGSSVGQTARRRPNGWGTHLACRVAPYPV